TIGIERAHFADRLRPMRRTTVGQIVAINRSDDRVREVEMAHSFGDVARLIRIKLHRLSFVDRAETAMARAGVAAEHEGRGAIRPALEDVRAARLLTDRVQVQAFDELQHVVLICRIAEPNLQPFRLRLAWLWIIDDSQFASHSNSLQTDLTLQLFYHSGRRIVARATNDAREHVRVNVAAR